MLLRTGTYILEPPLWSAQGAEWIIVCETSDMNVLLTVNVQYVHTVLCNQIKKSGGI